MFSSAVCYCLFIYFEGFSHFMVNLEVLIRNAFELEFLIYYYEHHGVQYTEQRPLIVDFFVFYIDE